MEEFITKRLLPVATKKQAIDFDRFTIDQIGISPKLLMENAGCGIANFILAKIGQEKQNYSVVILVGPGNNGADALVVARHLLTRDMEIFVFLVSEKNITNEALKEQLNLLSHAISVRGEDPHKFIKSFTNNDSLFAKTNKVIVIDGIFGAGLNRQPSGLSQKAIKSINAFKKQHSGSVLVLSVDIPSGLSLEAAEPRGQIVKADHTITFDYLKRAHISEPTKEACGKTTLVNIGLFTNSSFTNFLVWEKKALIRLFLPVPTTAHKGYFGHVLVYEGHPNFLGASRLSARAALRVGAGLLTIATDHQRGFCDFDIPEFMHRPKNELTKDFLRKIDALVFGPGLSRDEHYLRQGLDFLNSLGDNVPAIVFDADGLQLLKSHELNMARKQIIATPHENEAAQLLSCQLEDVKKDRFLALEALANLSCNQHHDIIWVLKGATTLVRSLSGEIFAFSGELPILAAGGSGDILSGTIAGLIKQTYSPFAATLLAVSVQIEAARRLSKKIFKGSLASELADLFPLITKR
jgi:hydroxyethylthiazole kinase-like uncharacterized protein yjeF